MTAVASPPSFQSLPRLGWNTGNGGQGGLNSMSADEVTRMFMPRKSVQRTNSSSSLASSSSSSSSSSSTIPAPSPPVNGNGISNGDSGTWASKKKPPRGLWPSSKAEPVSGVSNARPQAISTPSSGPTASSTMSAIQQPPPVLPSQQMHHMQQQNGIRGANGQPSNEPPAVLTLLPMNGTFERKQINVPFFPEVLRVGRQTNAKTVPTPVNGYFDSKVLSRQHAEVWADRNGKVWIRDVKSSNGTFVNGQRLSPENRDSEPHELREHDMLELGIDIVSEDQKTIVHHKVSAKVEHAGFYGSSTNVLDLNFGDIDPTAGGGLLPSPLSQSMSHMRGRPGSVGSMSNGRLSGPQSVAGSHMSALNQQRQMNFWLSPITIEQVVKKLTTEMKQAKQQSQDLNQTGDFLNSLLSPDPEKEKIKPSPTEHNPPRQLNGKPKMPKMDPISRFSDPPAPPPQQPLPEKPDSRSSPSDGSVPFLKRTETERPKSGMSNSPTSRESSSQILSLVEALTSAKKDLDSQGARVKHLEDLLRQERAARESAEERARRLESQPWRDSQGSEVAAAFEPPAERDEIQINGLDGSDKTHTEDRREWSATNGVIEKPRDTEVADSSAQHLQQRLDLMVAEMDEMKQQMERYRRRAESAEDEAISTRESLAEMIEKIRLENAETASAADRVLEVRKVDSSKPNPGSYSVDPATPSGALLRKSDMQNGKTIGPAEMEKLEHAVATVMASSRDRNDMLAQSAPYASMLGVVLIGVGLMAYLNGWQKMER